MISEKDIEKLAELSRIEISPEEKAGFAKEIDSILAYVGQIQEAKTSDDKTEIILPLRNVFREDKEPHETGKFTDELLKEVPKTENGYVKVKKILDDKAD